MAPDNGSNLLGEWNAFLGTFYLSVVDVIEYSCNVGLADFIDYHRFADLYSWDIDFIIYAGSSLTIMDKLLNWRISSIGLSTVEMK